MKRGGRVSERASKERVANETKREREQGNEHVVSPPWMSENDVEVGYRSGEGDGEEGEEGEGGGEDFCEGGEGVVSSRRRVKVKERRQEGTNQRIYP